jgi:hypothetical protein
VCSQHSYYTPIAALSQGTYGGFRDPDFFEGFEVHEMESEKDLYSNKLKLSQHISKLIETSSKFL